MCHWTGSSVTIVRHRKLDLEYCAKLVIPAQTGAGIDKTFKDTHGNMETMMKRESCITGLSKYDENYKG